MNNQQSSSQGYSQMFLVFLAPPPLPPKNVPTTGPSSTDDAGMRFFFSYCLSCLYFHF